MTHNIITLLATLLLLFVVSQFSYSQTFTPPYNSGFDNLNNDTIGWTTYSDDSTNPSVWNIGIPDGYQLDQAFSNPNVWGTNTAGYVSSSADIHYLETPSFDLSTSPLETYISFYQMTRSSSSNIHFKLTYSIDNGATWSFLDTNDSARNWQTTSMNGFDNNEYTNLIFSAREISDLVGEPNVKFRFEYSKPGNNNPGEGWLIDNFSITNIDRNLYTIPSDTIFISQNCHYDLELGKVLNYLSPLNESFPVTSNFYLSSDLTLDPSDQFLGTKTANVLGYWLNSTGSNYYIYDIDSIPNLLPGTHYILYECDIDANIPNESNYNDNIGHRILKVSPVYGLPYADDFESPLEGWRASTQVSDDTPLFWQRTAGNKHHIENAHSGEKSWNTGADEYGDLGWSESQTDYLNFPFFDLSNSSNTVLSIWFKNDCNGPFSTEYAQIKYQINCNEYFSNLSSFSGCDSPNWKHANIDLQSLEGIDNVTFRIEYSGDDDHDQAGFAFDDIYIGEAKADLSIEENDLGRYSLATENDEILSYHIANSGLVPSQTSITKFYWSEDAVLDNSDIFLGTNNESGMAAESTEISVFNYSKPNNNLAHYYIIYKLDDSNTVDEMREYNNLGSIKIRQETRQDCPYVNDFETEINGWYHNSFLGNDDWEWATPNGVVFNEAFSGTKAWITNADDTISDYSRMHLYTPPLNLSNINNPVLEFDMKTYSNDVVIAESISSNMSYTTDNGLTWTLLDTTNQSFSIWYYDQSVVLFGGFDSENVQTYNSMTGGSYRQQSFSSLISSNGKNSDNNTRFILDLGFLSEEDNVMFRYNIGTNNPNDEHFNAYDDPIEGMMLDNFSITEKFINLKVNYSKNLHINRNANQVKVFINIKNQGNYISEDMVIKYYLSNDANLDNSDYLLGSEDIAAIKPDRYAYMNSKFNAVNLNDYSYLIYELDATNTNTESNESDNVAAWELGEYIPAKNYFQDFEEEVLDGWHHWIESRYGFYKKEGFRVRTQLAPHEINDIAPYGYTNGDPSVYSGVLTNDHQEDYYSFSSDAPIFYIETPTFDFLEIDSAWLSFDLACTGINYVPFGNTDGGNMEFSLDGGNTWILLHNQSSNRLNWYTNSVSYTLYVFDEEKGWSEDNNNQGIPPTSLPRGYDLSFLKGEENVQFRYKYSSYHHHYGEGTYQGFFLDNFKIEGFELDYQAMNDQTPVDALISQNTLSVDYQLFNEGEKSGSPSTTLFYWSEDDILDASDIIINSTSEPYLSANTSYTNSNTFTIPQPINQDTYYLFYRLDINGEIEETNEDNNIGSFKVNFSDYTSISNLSHNDVQAHISDNTLYVKVQNDYWLNRSYSLNLFTMDGKVVLNQSIELRESNNEFPLPQSIPSGIYNLVFRNQEQQFSIEFRHISN